MGVGIGLSMPLDLDYVGPYAPVDNYKIYCGKERIPIGYDRRGSPAACLQKGVGVGKRQLANGR
jgi:hypothetical protein